MPVKTNTTRPYLELNCIIQLDLRNRMGKSTICAVFDLQIYESARARIKQGRQTLNTVKFYATIKRSIP